MSPGAWVSLWHGSSEAVEFLHVVLAPPGASTQYVKAQADICQGSVPEAHGCARLRKGPEHRCRLQFNQKHSSQYQTLMAIPPTECCLIYAFFPVREKANVNLTFYLSQNNTILR